MAKTHCAVNHHLQARQRVPHISMRRTQPMFRSHPTLDFRHPLDSGISAALKQLPHELMALSGCCRRRANKAQTWWRA